MTKTIFAVMLAASTLFFGCGESDPAGPAWFLWDNAPPMAEYSVDDYAPVYTGAQGTAFAGDYFPLAEGYAWYYSGPSTTRMTERMRVMGEEDGDSSLSSGSITTSSRVLASRQISLSTGPQTVFPVAAYMSDPDFTLDTAFYYKSGNVVFQYGAATEYGDIYEFADQRFLRSPLVTGDSWESSSEDMDSAMFIDEMGMEMPGLKFRVEVMDIRCKYIVVGPASVSLNGEQKSTVRVDRISAGGIEIYFDGKLEGYGDYEDYDMDPIWFIGTIRASLWNVDTLFLLRDTGLVARKSGIEMQIGISVMGDGITFMMLTEEQQDFSIMLDSCSLTVSGPLPKSALPEALNPEKHKAPFMARRMALAIKGALAALARKAENQN